MFACCGRPAAASLGDPFTYIVSTMRVKGSPKSARWGTPSRRRPLVRQAPNRRALTSALLHAQCVHELGRLVFYGLPLGHRAGVVAGRNGVIGIRPHCIERRNTVFNSCEGGLRNSFGKRVPV